MESVKQLTTAYANPLFLGIPLAEALMQSRARTAPKAWLKLIPKRPA